MSRMKLLGFTLNEKGVQELLKSESMQNILRDAGDKKAREAGEGYACDVHVAKRRAYANVYPSTKEAYKDNLDHNTLEKVIRS